MNSSIKPKRFAGKVAIVTSSTKGIGFATVKRLAQEGARVVMSSRKEENVRKAVAELRSEGLEVFGMVCHVGKQDQVQKLLQETVRRYGGLDILIPLSGVSTMYGPVLETTEIEYDKMFEVNVKAPFMLIKEAYPLMKQRGRGSVVLMSTYAAFDPQYCNVDGHGIDIYCVTKTALLGMTKALTPQLAQSNIRINSVAPGPIETDFFNGMTNRMAQKNLHRNHEDKVPLRRRGSPDEVASVITFLASEDAAYVTGENVIIAGGLSSRL